MRLLSLALALLACAWCQIQAADEVKLAVTDLEGLEQLQREFGAFRDLLAKESGYEITFHPVPNRTAAVEGLKAEKVDFVLTGPAEYVVFRTLTKAEPVISFSRPDYFCTVAVLAEGPIDSIADLEGKKVAIGSVGSTSKHLAPMQIFADNGLARDDFQPVHTSVELGWEALKKGDVAAWAMTNDKFLKLRGRDQDLEPGAFKVVARGRDLPNDVLLVGTHVDPTVTSKIKAVFVDHSQELVQAILQGEDNKKYKGMKFIAGVKDSDYDYVRKMYATIGYEKFSKFPGD